MNNSIIIAPQTKVALMGYTLILLAKIIMMIQDPAGTKIFTPFVLFYIGAAALGLYVLNCTVVGKCHLYAWIMSYILAILGLAFIVWLIYKVLLV